MSTPYYIILDTDGAFKEALLAAGTGVTLNYDPATRTTTIASIDLATINSISNPGGNIDLVAGSGISITPDSTAKTITITNTGGGGGGGVTSLNTLTGAVTLAAGTNVSLSVVGSTITVNATDSFGTLNSVTPSAGNIDLTSSTLTVTPNAGAHTVAIDIGSNSITDAEIGNRTVNQALATPGNTGLLTSLLSWLAGAIKAIKGTTNWYDTPATDLATAASHIANTSNPHSTTAAQVGAIATVNSITPSGTDFAVTAADSSITIGSATHGITVKANNSGVGSINGLTGTPSIAAGANISVTTSSPNITVAVSPQGTGSGLDADKVDGIHASGFAQLQSTLSSPTGQTGIVAVGGLSTYPIMQGNNTGAGNGLYGGTTYGGGVAILGESTNASGSGYGVTGHAVKGWGVRGYSDDSLATGVWAENTAHGAQLHIYPDLGPATVPADGDYGDGAMYAGLNGVLYYHTRGKFSIISRGRGTSFPASPQTNERFYRTDFKAEFEYNGSAWDQLSVGDCTSFPGSPTTNLRVRRTDRGIDYYYDGTRWLSCELKSMPFVFQPGATATITSPNDTASNGAGPNRVPFPGGDYSIYIVQFHVPTFQQATFDASNNWTIKIAKYVSGATNGVVGTVSTWATGRSAGTTYDNTLSVNAVYTTSDALIFSQDFYHVGTPGNVGVQIPTIFYRLVG